MATQGKQQFILAFEEAVLAIIDVTHWVFNLLGQNLCWLESEQSTIDSIKKKSP